MTRLVQACFLFLTLFIGSVFFCTTGSICFAKTTESFADRQEVQQFIQEMNVKHKINSQELTRLFKAISSDPKVIQAISKPFEDVPWPKYKEKFVNDNRANAGVEFWRRHEKTLKKAEAEFGVPAEIIVAIIGVETYYGRNTGNYPILQSLATLAFDYPPRANFFRGELEQFLLLIKEEKLDPMLTGSYAGAMGLPQFIPSSYRRYAVNFSQGNNRDLINNTNDVIGSVANYFRSHGWQKGEPIALEANVNGTEYQTITSVNKKDVNPKFSLAQVAKLNIRPKNGEVSNVNENTPVAFIILNPADPNNDSWLTLKNFYVITRYNHSVNYAMAVYQLSERIRSLYRQQS